MTKVNIISHGIPVQMLMLGQRVRGGMLRISLVKGKLKFKCSFYKSAPIN